MTADPRLIVPLDVPTVAEARALVERLGGAVGFYKVGLELFASDGMGLARELKAQGKQVFIDWKLHDIGTTVERAARALSGSGCDFLTVHGEPQVMASAVLGRGRAPLKILAVTVLTSLSDEDLPSVGLVPPVADQVLRLASLAQQCGLDGVVCSAHEIARLRSELGPEFLLVVPGIRPAGSAVGDQRRVMGPAEAQAAGADVLVIGRPITGAQDPALAARDIARSLGIPVI